MNDRERINALLGKGNADAMGLYDIWWSDTIEQWVSSGKYPSGNKDDEFAWFDIPNTFYHKEEAYPIAPQYHFDSEFNTGNYSQFWFDIQPIANYHPVVEETDEQIITLNGAGAKMRSWKHKSGTAEHLSFDLTDRTVWDEKYRHHLLDLDISRFDIDKIKRVQNRGMKHNKWTYYGTFFIWENARQCMGDVHLMESLLLDPEYIHDINRVYVDFFKTHFKYLFDTAGIPDGMFFYEDMAYKDTLFASPDTFRDLYFPYYTEIVEWLHSFGIKVVLHCCGFVEPLLPQIVDAGFDALHAMEHRAGCDNLRIAKNYGSEIALIGGVEVEMFESGDRAYMKKRINEVVEGMKRENARYCFSSDHSITTNVSYDDYRFCVDYFREISRY